MQIRRPHAGYGKLTEIKLVRRPERGIPWHNGRPFKNALQFTAQIYGFLERGSQFQVHPKDRPSRQ